MNKLFNKWTEVQQNFKKLKQVSQGYEENIFLVAGLLLVIGLPLFFLWNPISFNFNHEKAQARGVLQAVEIPTGGGDNGGNNGGNGGGNNGGGNNGGGTPPVEIPNGKPDIKDDWVLVRPGESVQANVLQNDQPRNNVPLKPDTFTITKQPDKGTIQILPGNIIKYTPNPGVGVTKDDWDTVRYEVSSENGQKDDAQLGISIIPVGFPEPMPDEVSTYENTPIDINVLANDKPRDTVPIKPDTLVIEKQPNHGTVTINPDKTIKYNPTADYSGPDEFWYVVCAQNGLCDHELVKVNVIEIPDNPVDNQPPIAANDSATTQEGNAVTVNALNNDFDQDGDLKPEKTTITVQPGHGTATVNTGNGAITYTPTAGYSGTDTLTYQIEDNDGAKDTAVITITVTPDPTPANNPPVANNDAGTTQKNAPITVDVLTNDSDQDNDLKPDTLTITAQPAHGTAVVNEQNKVVYTPANNYVGNDTFTYRISDSKGASDTATVAITVAEIPVPVANDDTTVTKKNNKVTVDILANDTSPSSPLNPSSVIIVTQPTHGSVTVKEDGKVEYTPTSDYSGPDSFVYRVSNSAANPQSDVATVSVNVQDVATPKANNDQGTTKKNVSTTIDILANDTIPGSTVTKSNFDSFTVQPSHGTVTFDQTTGKAVYTPANNYTGSDSFTYKIKNNDGTSTATVLINVQNPVGPDAVDDVVITGEKSPISISVLDNDDANEGTLVKTTLTVETQPSNGVTSIDTTTGKITYTPNEGFIGTDTFTYEVGNSVGGFDTATVLVTVKEEPAPEAKDDNAQTDVNKQITVSVLDNDFDSSDSILKDQVKVVLQPNGGDAKVNTDGTITYTPNPGFQGIDTFVYQIRNESGKTDVATVTVLVKQTAPIDISQSKNGPGAGQVLGVSEKAPTGELPRTGGAQDMIANLTIIVGVMLAGGFFASLYFIKSNKTRS